jgi:pimeloyl-ACP methyl ester carboxylesterase
MPFPMPEIPGVEHTYHELPTGVRVHVASSGPADAPPLLALHGFPQHWWAWREVMRELDGEFRVIAPDMRGFGWSGWPDDGSFLRGRMADDALALLDALGLERVRLAGHDWGAWAAIVAALDAPERFSSLLVMSIGHMWVPTDVALRNIWRLWYQLPLAAPLAGEAVVRDGRFVRQMFAAGRRDGREWTEEELETYLAPLRTPTGARAGTLIYRQFLTHDLPSAARGEFRGRKLQMPARMLFGRRDGLGRDFAAGFEHHSVDGAFEIVDDAGHFLPEEAPAVVADRVRAMA